MSVVAGVELGARYERPVPPAVAGGRPNLRLVPTGAEVAADRPRAASWRLTRRGRAVLLGLLVVLLVVGAVGWGAASADGAPTESPRSETVIVGEGDTLWSIAADVAPGGDRRATIERIKAANGLQGSRVEPGQQLVVPAATP